MELNFEDSRARREGSNKRYVERDCLVVASITVFSSAVKSFSSNSPHTGSVISVERSQVTVPNNNAIADDDAVADNDAVADDNSIPEN